MLKSKYQMRMDNLHNCNKVHDYKIKVSNISKESVPISRNKDSADFIEQEIIGEDYESSRDYPNVIQSKRFNKEHEIKNLVTHNQLSDFLEDADSKIVMTPGSNGFESVGKQRIQKNRFEESKEYEKKNLSSLVTKPQISIHFIKIDITVLINAINTDIKIIQWVESYL